MSTIYTLPDVVARYRLDASGYDVGEQRFTDLAGLDQHIPVISGSPVHADVGGVNALTNIDDGTMIAATQAPADFGYTFIMSLWSDLSAGADGTRYPYVVCQPDIPPSTHGTGTPDFTHVTSGATINTALRLYGTQIQWSKSYSSTTVGVAPVGAWSVVMGCVNPVTGRLYLSVDGGAWIEGSAAHGSSQYWFDTYGWLTLGEAGNGLPNTSGNTLGVRDLVFIQDCVYLNNPDGSRDAATALLAEINA